MFLPILTAIVLFLLSASAHAETFVCSELDELTGNCLTWVPELPLGLPYLSPEDATTLSLKILCLWATAFVYRKLTNVT